MDQDIADSSENFVYCSGTKKDAIN